MEQAGENLLPDGFWPQRREREEGDRDNFQQKQAEKDHQDPAPQGDPAAEPGKKSAQVGELGETGSQRAEKTVGENSSQVKRGMMKNAFPPKSRRPGTKPPSSGPDIERVGHHQGTAHPQAMEASDKADHQRSEEIKYHNLKVPY